MSNSIETLNFAPLRLLAGLTIPELVDILGVSERTLYRWERGEVTPKKGIMDLIRSQVIQKNHSYITPNFTFIDLFAGIGGLRRGFDSLGGKCVFTSEWDKYAQLTYKANYPCDHEVAGDITKIDAENIPKHDVLLAGFPCQPFSIAGVSKKNSLGRLHGFRCDTQGTLFFDVARIIQHHRPKIFLLENVKNLVSHDKGLTFKVIYNTLTKELGYHVDYKIINAKSFVPQNRERIFIAGFRDDTSFSFNGLKIPPIESGPTLSTILHSEDGTETPEKPFTEGEIGTVCGKYTLTDHLWNYLQNYAAKHRAKGNGFGFGLCTGNDVARTLSARYYKDGSEILIDQGGEKNPRRLTPRECARLMGFDLPKGSQFKIPVSDTQAYKQFGNAVVVPVVDFIAKYMAPYIFENRSIPQPSYNFTEILPNKKWKAL